MGFERRGWKTLRAPGRTYSDRKVIAGSTRAARRAGHQVAAMAVRTTSAATLA